MSGNLGSQFYPKLVQMSSELGIKPEDLLAVMVSESGINPSAKNPGGARGLIQFMPKTLQGVGFKDDPNKFLELSGEEQLPYIKRLIEGNIRYAGQPITSAAQYYVANFFPVALKLPGVKAGDPSTPIVEDNPATLTDPKTGKQVSAKYYQIGVNISPQLEHAAYKTNPLFHGSTHGAITYGDLMKQVEKNKQSPIYQNALTAMERSSGYTPDKQPTQMLAQRVITPDLTLEKFLQIALAQEDHQSQFLISIQVDQMVDAMEFARVACCALETELHAQAYPHTDGSQRVEIECQIPLIIIKAEPIVDQLLQALSDTFQDATVKLGGIQIEYHIDLHKTSQLNPLSSNLATSLYRQFQLKYASAS